jgi:nicotinamidase-related amidase
VAQIGWCILRDLGLTSFAICGVATEIGIEPTVKHGADLGLVPVVIRDACGAGNPEAAGRSFANIEFMADAVVREAHQLIEAVMPV